jgi:choline dehydrogenase-like flavoprotein
MANFNIDAKKEMTYDAIVIGSGISGGWAAKELCEKGLKVLVEKLKQKQALPLIIDFQDH